MHKITQLRGNTGQRFNVTAFVYVAPWKYHGTVLLAGVAGELRAASAFEWSVATPGGTYPGLGKAYLAWLLFLRMLLPVIL